MLLILHRAVGRSDLEKEKDSETVKVRRLEKTCDKYCRQLEQARIEITDLKAQLLESTKYQVSSHTVWLRRVREAHTTQIT